MSWNMLEWVDVMWKGGERRIDARANRPDTMTTLETSRAQAHTKTDELYDEAQLIMQAADDCEITVGASMYYVTLRLAKGPRKLTLGLQMLWGCGWGQGPELLVSVWEVDADPWGEDDINASENVTGVVRSALAYLRGQTESVCQK